jgi:riboflavin biosynthesis pyrimidine reductase
LQTVQLVIHDSQHAYSLRDLLLGDGVHQVVLMERPNWAMPGVIVVDSDQLDVDQMQRSVALADGRERVVVMASRASAELSALWRAGVRHVVFHGDAPRTVRVSVLATELSLTASSY